MSPGCKVQFIKKRQKESVIRYFRSDGSVSWHKIHSGTEDHDLAHFAVESVMEYKRAFFGLLETGIEIGDFSLPNDQKPAVLRGENLPYEAVVTEYIVNLLQTDQWNSNIGDQFHSVLRKTLSERGVDFPEEFNEKRLQKIWQVFNDLLRRWQSTPVNQVFELSASWLDAH